MTDDTTPSRRDRARAATVAEIKATALGLMRRSGTTDVKFADIAREMGMTAPALYRYFADGDALITALIIDAYGHLGEAVAAARDDAPAESPSARLLAGGQAYRQWARSEPQQFALIFGMPVPGYAAPDDGPTTEAAHRAMGQLQALFMDAAHLGLLGPPLVTDVDEDFVQSLMEAHDDDLLLPGVPNSPLDTADVDDRSEGVDGAAAPQASPLSPESFQAMLNCWVTLHGFASLEAYGHLDWLSPAARDAMFRANVALAARCAGFRDAPSHAESAPTEP